MSTGNYKIVFAKKAEKQLPELKGAHLDGKVKKLLDLIRQDPLGEPPPYEELRGDLKGCCSRRINLHHRLVYTIHEEEKTVRILSMWTHYATLHEEKPITPG